MLRASAGILAFGWGCGEGTAPPEPVATVAIQTEQQPVDLVAGATQLLTAVAKDAKGNPLTDRITTWTSSDDSKVTVVAGVVTGIAIGSATITASVEGRTTTIDVRVKNGAVVSAAGATFSAFDGLVSEAVPAGAVSRPTSFTVETATAAPANPRLMPGTAFVFGPSGTNFPVPVVLTIKYRAADLVASSPESGLQLYELVGSAWRVVEGSTVNLTDKTVSGAVSRFGTYAVMMLPKVDVVTIAGDLTPIAVVTTRQLTTLLKDNEGTTLTRPVSWSSSNPAVLTINAATGLVTPVALGSATVTASSEGKSGTAEITIVAGPPAKLVGFAGNNQSAAAGTAVATPPAVLVTDAVGNPLTGVPVVFAVASGSGTVVGGSVSTNSAGIAAVTSWTLGAAAGPNSLTATSPSVAGQSFTFQAAGGAGAAAVIAPFAGNNLTGTAGGLVPTRAAVKVTDINGNFVAGYPVTFTVASGGGSVIGGTVTTDAAGIATVGNWRLGTAVGAQTLAATAAGLSGSPVTFTATAIAPVASTIAAFAGANQTTRPGAAVAIPPAVLVTDPAGIPVPDVAVVFAVASGGGSITGATATTNANGVATVGSWTLGSTAGANSLTASSGALAGSPITFTATGIPNVLAIFSGNNQSARPGTAVPNNPIVKVTDANGAGVAGVTVTFAVASGGGSATSTSVNTNVDGIAAIGSWTLGPSVGPNTLTASAPADGSPVTFTATAQFPPPAAMSINAGNNQTAFAGQPVPITPAVRVTDAQGIGLPGITVHFSVRSGSGTITGTDPVTNAAGIATLGTWVLGIGGNSLSATVTGVGGELVFVALGTAQVQIVTFGDSNTDWGMQGSEQGPRVASYISGTNTIRLAASAPNSPLQLAGKIEARWRANRNQTIRAVNHAINGTSTGTGRNLVFSPNALEQVNGVSRFRGEVLGDAYPWYGGEQPSTDFYPNGGIQRVQAFTPRPSSDFAYISMGTNDVTEPPSNEAIRINLEIMIDEWISRGLPANRLFITTLPPRAQNSRIPDLNGKIRALAQAKGVRLIDIAFQVSDDNGLNWRATLRDPAYGGPLHSGDQIHYAEVVRNWIADQIVSAMLAMTPP